MTWLSIHVVRRLFPWILSVAVYLLASAFLEQLLSDFAWASGSLGMVLSSLVGIQMRGPGFLAQFITALALTSPILFPLSARIAAVASLLAWSPMLACVFGLLSDRQCGDGLIAIIFPLYWLAVVAVYVARKYLPNETVLAALVLSVVPPAVLFVGATLGFGILSIFLFLPVFPFISLFWFLRSFGVPWRRVP